MALTPEATARITEHLKAKWKFPCPMCRSNEWTLNGYVALPLADQPNTIIIGGGAVLPAVAVVCRNCGNTVLVNAVIAGIQPPGAQVSNG
jgi:predicted RNA-binding Zn-ribbon protein involved in translation (DUF1610 family)